MSENLTPGRIVLYKLSESDCQRITLQREASQYSVRPVGSPGTFTGQLRIGNTPNPGDVVPAIVVTAWTSEMFNGQALLDGNDALWLTSVHEGDGEGQFTWPINSLIDADNEIGLMGKILDKLDRGADGTREMVVKLMTPRVQAHQVEGAEKRREDE